MTNKRKSQLFDEYYLAQQNMSVDTVCKTELFSFVESDLVEDGFCNFVYNIDAKNFAVFEKTLDLIGTTMKRPSHVTIRDFDKPIRYQKSFENMFELDSHDVWFWSKIENIVFDEKKCNNKVKFVVLDNPDDYVYLIGGFATHDSNDPYGELSPTYAQEVRKNWNKQENGFVCKHYACKLNGKFVALMTTSVKENFAVLNDLVVLKPYRNKGISTALQKYVFNKLMDMGIVFVLFCTAKDYAPEKIYIQMGHTPLFESKLYKRK